MNLNIATLGVRYPDHAVLDRDRDTHMAPGQSGECFKFRVCHTVNRKLPDLLQVSAAGFPPGFDTV